MSHLLQAYAYISAGQLYESEVRASRRWASWIVQFLMTMVDAILSLGVTASVGKPLCPAVVEFILVVSGQVFVFIACKQGAAREWVGAACVPLCFACHLAVNVLGYYRLDDVFAREAPGDSPSELGSYDDSDTASEITYQSKGKQRSLKHHRRLGNMSKVGNGTVVFAWLLCLGWALCHSVFWDPMQGSSEEPSAGRRLQGAAGLREVLARLDGELAEEQRWGRALEAQLADMEAALLEERSCRQRELQAVASELGGALGAVLQQPAAEAAPGPEGPA
mmetsp:Transcript_94048/g.285640  ORF Transcript_94048/g.285640 Transcript_94048/m.285640 type:complete len:278 (+) Transcript_94048:3-836(+)